MQHMRKLILALLVLLLATALMIAVLPQQPVEAHHMSPNEYNLERGNLNEDMVHYGVEVRTDTGALENGTLHWSNPWTP